MFKIDFQAFLASLPIMAKGMAGILIVTLLIIGTVFILNASTAEKKPEQTNDEQTTNN